MSAIPPFFIENVGQFPKDARFVMRRNGGVVACTPRGISIAKLDRRDSTAPTWRGVAFDFTGDACAREPVACEPLESTSHFFRGGDEAGWFSSARHFASLVYEQVGTGIDLRLVVRDGEIAYDLLLAPFARLDDVEFVAHHVDRLTLEEDGTLVCETEVGSIRHTLPKAWYQGAESERVPAICRFELRGEGRFGFRLEGAALDRQLFIDPGLVWSTYFGGNVDESVNAVDVAGGLVTIAGSTTSDFTSFPVFPTTAPPNLQADLRGGAGSPEDAFIARLDPTKQGAAQLLWAAYLGGTKIDIAHDLVVQTNGNFAVVGKTQATGTAANDFPVTSATAIQPLHPRPNDGYASFVSYVTVRTTPSLLLTLTYSTFYGHPENDTWANAVALNDGRVITFGGRVYDTVINPAFGSIPFPGPSYPQPRDTRLDSAAHEGFFARIDRGNPGATPPIPSAVTYATYLSESGQGSWPPGNGIGGAEEVTSIEYVNGFVYLGGWSDSWDMNFPSNAFIQAFNQIGVDFNGYLMQFDPTDPNPATQLVYGTFIGGDQPIVDQTTGLFTTADDRVFDIDVFGEAIYACGRTSSIDFPVTTYASPNVEGPGYWHVPPQWVTDYAFVVKLIPAFNPASSQQDLRYGSYLGGSSVDWAHSIIRVADQAAAVVGYTASDGSSSSGGWAFPTGGASGSSFDSTHNGANDGFITDLNWSPLPPPAGHPIASQLRYSSFLGTSANDRCLSCDIDGFTVYVGGVTAGSGFPTSVNTFDVTLNGASDGFASSFTLPTNWP